MAFTPIETQEQFDEAVKDRVARAKDSVRKEYEGYASPEDVQKTVADKEKQISKLTESVNTLNGSKEESKKQLAEKDTTINELNNKIKEYETATLKTNIALKHGIPFEMAQRLAGDDEEALEKDAENIAQFINKGKTPPESNPEAQPTDGVSAHFYKLNPGLKRD